MENKLSSYQKLKQENSQLRQDIYNLVRRRKEKEGMTTAIKYETGYMATDALLMGWGSSDKLRGVFG